jgi:hypothetical protein
MRQANAKQAFMNQKEKAMKKGFVLAVVIGALIFATTAFAGTRYYSGKDSDSRCGQVPHTTCNVTFAGNVKDGKVNQVSDFAFDGIPITCRQGSFALTITDNPLPDMRVGKYRKFSGHFHTANQVAFYDVTGQFTKDYKSASGTIRVHGDFPRQATACDTGVDHYSVKRLQAST